MTTAQILGMTDVSWRARWVRRRRLIVPVIAALLVIGAFLMWGPIGLGNGPLSAGQGGVGLMTDAGPGPVAFGILLQNSGRCRPVIDTVTLIGGTSYAAPRELGLNVETQPQCYNLGSARPDGHSFVIAGCGNLDGGPLIGHSVGPLSQGFFGAAEVAAPRPGACWVMTKIVIHYHVGFRHYAATDNYALVVCGEGATAQMIAAAHAAGV
jgi:hypothetical protein